MNVKSKLFGLRSHRRGEKGFTILEYCAGAAVVIGVVWAAMTTLGTSVSGLIGSISNWAQSRSTEIQGSSTGK